MRQKGDKLDGWRTQAGGSRCETSRTDEGIDATIAPSLSSPISAPAVNISSSSTASPASTSLKSAMKTSGVRRHNADVRVVFQDSIDEDERWE